MKLKMFHKRLYHRSDIDETEYPPVVWERKQKLEYYAKLRLQGCTEQVALEVLGLKRATYYRWKRRYNKLGLDGLDNESKRPYRIRTPLWSRDLEQKILVLRRQNPLWGKNKIAFVLKRDFGLEVSESTVGRIITKFLKKGKIKPANFFYRNKLPRARQFNHYAKRWKRGMRGKKPGELLQIDHMHVPMGSGIIYKHFKAVCPVTRITTEQAYTTATSTVARKFLEHAIQDLPFEISSIQVDGGSEFMGEFENLCKELGIPLYVLPPRSPKYNGNVERCNSTVKYEFYYQYTGPRGLHIMRKRLQKYVNRYNSYRPHQALQNLTPLQYYQKISGGA